MNAVSLDPNLLLQFFLGLLWAFVWVVVVLFGVELICVVALWFRDGREGGASPTKVSTGAEASVPGSG